MIKKIIFLILFLVFVAGITLVHAANRVALVVGNSAYKTTPLKNPVNDAKDMAYVLKNLGFEVLLLENADKQHQLSNASEYNYYCGRRC